MMHTFEGNRYCGALTLSLEVGYVQALLQADNHNSILYVESITVMEKGSITEPLCSVGSERSYTPLKLLSALNFCFL